MAEIAFTHDYEVGLLLPANVEHERTMVRYGGLVSELSQEVSVVLLHGQDSYQDAGVFSKGKHPVDAELGAMEVERLDGAVRVAVVRDLTMPKDSTKLYEDTEAPVLVHSPAVNAFLRSKSDVYECMPSEVLPYTITRVDAADVGEAVAEVPNDMVVVKPDTGSASNGVLIGDKKEVMSEFSQSDASGQFVVQETIDMSRGVPEYSVNGMHNLRFIVIDGKPIYGFYREDETGSRTFAGEPSLFKDRIFRDAEAYSESVQAVLNLSRVAIESALQTSETVLAVDLIRGTGHDGEMRDYLLEINRRPLRNSPYDGNDVMTLQASRAWDVAEANMLARITKAGTSN